MRGSPMTPIDLCKAINRVRRWVPARLADPILDAGEHREAVLVASLYEAGLARPTDKAREKLGKLYAALDGAREEHNKGIVL